jgi:multidrug efflux pump subunit AcrB
MNESKVEKAGFAGKLAAYFINSRLTLLIVIFSMLLGLMAISLLPREEEPQIKVPMIDVMVSMAGATPAEIEQQVTIPMEKLLYELPGVE